MFTWIRKFSAVLLGLLLCGTASAEMMTGTVIFADPDDKQITLRRDGTLENITIAVGDQDPGKPIQEGSKVVADVVKDNAGGWKTGSVDAVPKKEQNPPDKTGTLATGSITISRPERGVVFD